MMTVTVLILLAALVCTIASAVGRCPLWVAVLLIWVVQALQVLPH